MKSSKKEECLFLRIIWFSFLQQFLKTNLLRIIKGWLINIQYSFSIVNCKKFKVIKSTKIPNPIRKENLTITKPVQNTNYKKARVLHFFFRGNSIYKLIMTKEIYSKS